jgi:hypothetical protein
VVEYLEVFDHVGFFCPFAGGAGVTPVPDGQLPLEEQRYCENVC